MFEDKLQTHARFIREELRDLPEITNWHWTDDFSEPDEPPPLAKGQPRAGLFSDA
jgi:xylulose-5-phosphate/fructose-6-phosphate phosphoketolase